MGPFVIVTVWSHDRPVRKSVNIDPGPPLVIGRELTEQDDHVSTRHASITVVDSGRVVIAGLGSRNHTYVNGRKIDGPVELADGDVIRTGETVWLILDAILLGTVWDDLEVSITRLLRATQPNVAVHASAIEALFVIPYVERGKRIAAAVERCVNEQARELRGSHFAEASAT